MRADARIRKKKEDKGKGFVKCGNCNVCSQAWEIDRIVSPELKIDSPLKFVTSCATKHCIYLIESQSGLR